MTTSRGTIGRIAGIGAALAIVAAAATAATAAAGGSAVAVGDWTVAPAADGKGCFLSRTYDHPGDTTLLLGLDGDGSNHLSVLNAHWSIKPKDRLALDFRLSGGRYAGHFAIGIASDGKQGFVTSFEPQFPAYFAASPSLAIARGTVPVERLSLEGSGAAVAELRRCVAALRQGPAASAGAAGAAEDAIPRDPFAAPPARRRKR